MLFVMFLFLKTWELKKKMKITDLLPQCIAGNSKHTNKNSPQPPSHSPLILSCPNCGCSHPRFSSWGRYDAESRRVKALAENRPPHLPLKMIFSARRHQNGRWYSLSITFHFYLTSPLPLHLPVISSSLFSPSPLSTVNRLR